MGYSTRYFKENDLKDLLKTKGSIQVADASGVVIRARHNARTGKTRVTFLLKSYKFREYGKSMICKTLGEYPFMGIDEARAQYIKMLGKLEKGESLKPKPKKHEPTFGDVYDEWLHTAKVRDWSEGSIKKNESVRRQWLSKIEKDPITSVTPQTMLGLVKPAMDDGKICTARRVVTTARAVLDYAVVMGMIQYNPLARLVSFMPKEHTKHYAAFSDETQAADMTGLFSKISDLPLVTYAAISMAFFTLLRNAEVRNLKFSDIHGDCLITKTKTMAAFKQPLSRQAKEIIEAMRKVHPKSDYIFYGTFGPLSVNALNKALASRGYGDVLKIHGIRTLGRQYMQTIPNAKESLIEMCLSHVVGGKVAQSYNRGEYLDERRELMQSWGDYVQTCMGDNYIFSQNGIAV